MENKLPKSTLKTRALSVRSDNENNHSLYFAEYKLGTLSCKTDLIKLSKRIKTEIKVLRLMIDETFQNEALTTQDIKQEILKTNNFTLFFFNSYGVRIFINFGTEELVVEAASATEMFSGYEILDNIIEDLTLMEEALY